MITQALPWLHPLAAADKLAANEECWALLYSGQLQSHSGRYSYLALYPQERVSGSQFSDLAAKLSDNRATLENAWFGYLGYEMLHDAETLPHESSGYIILPDLDFTRYGLVLQFDHEHGSVLAAHDDHIKMPHWPRQEDLHEPPIAHVASLTSPTTREAYINSVMRTRERIMAGDFYQANITRKFTGSFAESPHAFGLFRRLNQLSPATYSAFIRKGDEYILSSSPERFLQVNADGRMESRPIKGTAARGGSAAQDKALRRRLEKSEKDRAENLMIVDLMRNDLSRSALENSVQVERLFEVSTYPTLHHMASTVIAQKHPSVSTLEAIAHAFPPGSMTGAPKIRAMQWCMEQERLRRGVYSGALGWFGGDGSCDLSVVIRTLVIKGDRFEFQVGGGIVADSDPVAEWQETMTKSKGICAALEIDIEKLEQI